MPDESAPRPREVHLELLLGRRVLDVDGAVIGRVEEIRCGRDGDDLVVLQYLVGTGALLERFALPVLRSSVVARLLPRARRPLYEIPWDLLDVADPEHPRLRCRRDDAALVRT